MIKVDFMKIIGDHYTTVMAECTGDFSKYSNIHWAGGDKLPSEEELLDWALIDFKIDKITNLSNSCQKDIISGFTSDGLGYLCMYDSELEDQTNLGLTITNISPMPDFPNGLASPYAIRPIVDGVIQSKIYVMHSYAQLRKVMYDGGIYKLILLQKFNNKRDLVNSMTTLEDINNIKWEVD